MSTVGPVLHQHGATSHPWNISGDTNLSAIGGRWRICLFSYLGVETAAVAAAKVRDPDRNVPKATIYGTLASAVVYLLSLIAVFGIVPTSALAWTSNASVLDRGQRDRSAAARGPATWWRSRSSSPASARSTAGR